jgi:uncharacterized membrane protein YoaK (UPF0700 family)
MQLFRVARVLTDVLLGCGEDVDVSSSDQDNSGAVASSSASQAWSLNSWIVLGGSALACVAGYINAVMLMGVYHVPVSHMTGASTHLSVALAEGDGLAVCLTLGLMAGFALGAIVSGAIIGARTVRIGRRYGLVLAIEGIILCIAGLLAWKGNQQAVPLSAFACGLQNAMASNYHGLIVRTTHVTGIVTDLGAMLGRRLRRHPVRRGDFVMLLCLLVAFIVGGVIGAVMQHRLGPWVIGLAGPTCLVAGLAYFIWRHLKHIEVIRRP